MADNFQNESALPVPGDNKRTVADLLPRFFRTEANKKFLQSTLDQLVQPGVVEKISGYVGRKNAKAFSPTDNYIGDVTPSRSAYQLEPAAVIKDSLDNVTFYKDYNDYINQINALGGNTSNHSRLNSQESYSWNPNIDWDKFVNFREYYWLPNGPTPVKVAGQSRDVVSTYTVTLTDNGDNFSYLFSPDGFTSNPTLKLYRGQTYRFEIDTPGHPLAFSISRTFTPGNAVIVAGTEGIRGPGLFDAQLYGNEYDLGEYIVLPSSGSVTFGDAENVSTLYPDGIRKLGEEGEEIANVYVEKGVIEFTIPFNAPDRLYYISKNDIDVSGLIKIFDIEENTFLDVSTEILGKKTYLSANGVELSNGMKIKFVGATSPAKYSEGFWNVEGVGSQIRLISDQDLIIPAAYSDKISVPFDSDGFDTLPFNSSESYAASKDYIVINRASQDRNPWSRYNKWVHKNVLLKVAEYNNIPYDIDENQRAKRPIIEFNAGIKLFNYGTYAKVDVDLIDTFTTDVFSTVEGSLGYNIDGVDLAEGMRILFVADTDQLVNGKIYRVKFVTIGNNRQISLIETEDTQPLDLETVFVLNGVENAGKTFHYHGDSWVVAQEKTKRNQPPLFDLCCPQGNQYGDENIFAASTFKGTKLFSYAVGSGSNDVELGFPLSYRNINNSGDILFDFNLLTDTFTVQTDTGEVNEVSTSIGNLRKYYDRTNFDWFNGWAKVPNVTQQKVIRHYIAALGETNNFEIDVYDRAGLLTDLKVIVYLNNKIQKEEVNYTLDRVNKKAFVRFFNELEVNDSIIIKTLSSASKNSNGWYDLPINFERNPLNEDITNFTLGEVIDHVDGMVEDIVGFTGTFPGPSNLRDLGNLNRYGKKFVKHSGPVNLALYHITNKKYNILKALQFNRNEYSKFKRTFIDVATDLGYDGPVREHVNKVLKELNKDKVKTQPFYFSDMVEDGSTSTVIEYEILDVRNPYYPLSQTFSLNTLTQQAVTVYLNSQQLLFGRDYTFSDGFLLLTPNGLQQEGDILQIYETTSTDGSFIPPTPTKLGLYPKYYPQIEFDDTFIADEPTTAGPFKIYGQVESDETIGWFYPVYTSRRAAQEVDASNSATQISFQGLNKVLYIPTNTRTFGGNDNPEFEEYPIGVALIRGHDGSLVKVYKDYRDALILELERRIFNNIKVSYEDSQLDLHDFIPGKFRRTGFTKDDLNNSLRSSFVSWLRLVDSDYTLNDFHSRDNQFTFNYSNMTSVVDGNALPGFWRGVYKELYDTDRPHSHPWEMLGFSIKPLWWNEVYGPAPYTGNNGVLWSDLEQGIVREPGKPIVVLEKYARPGLFEFIPVDNKGKLLSPLAAGAAENFFFRYTTQSWKFGDEAPVETAWRRHSEYPYAVIEAWLINQPAKVMGIGFDVSRIYRNLAGQYVYGDSLKPLTLSGLVLPNTYNDTQRIQTAGLVNFIYNLVASNILTVYDDYKQDLSNLRNQLGFKLAGFTDKEKLKLLLDSRSPSSDISQGIFVPDENYQVFLNTSSPISIANYSGVIVEKTASGFIIRGYNDAAPFFNYYAHHETQLDPVVTVGGLAESATDWSANKRYVKGQLLINNFKYYRVTDNFTSGDTFTTQNLALLPELPIVGGKRAIFRKNFDKRTVKSLSYGTKLSTSQEVVDFLLGYNEYLISIGFEFDFFNRETEFVENWDHAAREFLFWTTQGWAAGTTIALSPASSSLVFNSKYSVVDDVFDDFYTYSLLKQTGETLAKKFISIYRKENAFEITTKNTTDGIYNISLPLVQKEHVVLIDNTTVFNDIIYQPNTGYRQERLNVLGYRSDNWFGGLDIPGFIFDSAETTDWKSWTDYNIGSLVRYKQFYYVALSQVTGSEEFNSSFWYRLNEKPESKLYTNFDYKINQFGDFYDLDSGNFDVEQQRLAQHLIGYQKRDYLANIIKDDVSQYKFYQGFIQDKGTKNALSKLFDPLSTSIKNSFDFYEEWAIQVGRYGAIDNTQQVEFVLDEEKFQESPQPIELVKSLPVENFDKVYRILPHEVYDKPENYTHAPFPTTLIDPNFLMSSGYVHEDDVKYKAGSLSELETADINQLQLGEYIWLTKTQDDSWTVYQLAETIANVTALANTETFTTENKPLFSLTLDRWAKSILNAGDFVAVKGAGEYSINGIYKVDYVDSSSINIELPIDNEVEVFDNEEFSLIKLRKVRVDNLNAMNSLIQERLYDDQIVWVDDYKDGNWAVYKNNPVYKEITQTITNPASFDSTDHEFSRSMTVTDDNKTLFVSSPGYGNGVVYHYRRSRNVNNLIQDPDLVPPSEFLDLTNSRFGESVSVSPDGEYLAVGIPYASEVKTKFKGDFDASVTYNKNEIIRYRESLWKANKQILPTTTSQPFSSFDTYVQLARETEADSTSIRLLIAGNPGLENSISDHFLVRAPLDMYLGTKTGDIVKLAWNIRSFAYPTLDNYYPFDNENALTLSVIQQQHVIAAKIDHILFIETFVGLPDIGDRVTTDTGSAIVEYVAFKGDSAVIYVKDTNGIIDITGDLYINDEDFIGIYTEENTYKSSENLGGFWLFSVASLVPGGEYNNNSRWYDIGRGLVYVDVLLSEESSATANEYYNIQTTIGTIGAYVFEKDQASFIGNLSYRGDPGGIEADYADNKWVVRGSKVYTDIIQGSFVAPSSPLNPEIEFRLYDLDNRDIDVAAAGLSYEILNKKQKIVDLWDGYIDFEYTRFDFAGNVFEPVIGDILEDVQTPFDEFGGLALTSYTTSTAEVVYYQRDFNFVRVYVKNKTGNWAKLNNIGRVELRRRANTAARGSGDVSRIIGTVNDFNNDVVLGTSLVGKLIVFQHTGLLPVVSNPYITDEEYYFFVEDTIGGDGRDENPPNSLNKDYTQVYNISADEYGEPGPANSGAVAIYNRIGNGSYKLLNVLQSEYAAANRRFGQKVKIVKNNGLYTLLVSSVGDDSLENYGSIEIFKNGYRDSDSYKGYWNLNLSYTRNDVVLHRGEFYKATRDIVTSDNANIFNPIYWNKISWRQAKDENYRGELNTSYPYALNAIVSFEENLYRAKTNIATGSTLSFSNWELVTNNLDYLGILPNRSGNAFFDETVYQPSAEYIERFATDFEISKNGSVIAVLSKQVGSDSSTNVKLLVYRLIDEKYNLDQTIVLGRNSTKLAMSPDGNIIAVSEPENDDRKTDQGKVEVYRLTNNIFVLSQTLLPPQNEESEKFGSSISFSSDNLVVTSLNGDMTIPTTFDVSNGIETSFDKGFTTFKNTIKDTGMVYIFEDIEDNLVFSESFKYDNRIVSFGENLLANTNHIYVGMPRVGNDFYKGTILEYRKSKNTFAWERPRELVPPVDLSKIRGAFLYNKRTNQVVTYLDFIDPIQGKIAGVAEQEIKHKVAYDPANYNVGVFTGVNQDTFWADEHVGELWWNLRTARFTYPYQGDLQYQKSNWNELQPGSSIDVYEWVESRFLPSQWDELADTAEGMREKISGQSVYSDNLYSQKYVYDEVTKTFSNRFYFWVERKLTVPDQENRTLSAFDIARLIATPRQQGYRFINFLGADRFILNNCDSLIYNQDIVLNIRYAVGTNLDQNKHSAYYIMSEGDQNSLVNPDIERKWFDSLVGYDEQNNVVPAENLTPRQKYGIQNRPRQSMFVNRVEALKQYFERVNIVCKNNLLVDIYDLNILSSSEEKPLLPSNLYDVEIDTLEELRFVSTNKLQRAELTPIVQNGKIVRVDIDNPGRGYKVPPSYTLVGAGKDAEFNVEINNLGQVTRVTILNNGSGYGENTRILVRSFSVLISADSSINGKWSIYNWNVDTKSWFRTSIQDYSVSNFWEYIDWYETGYNEFTPVNFEVDQSSDIQSLVDRTGDIVKIKNVGTGGWLLLEKIANQDNEDYTVNYKTVGRENGTIKFKDTLYNYGKNSVGFDNKNFDVEFYDVNPVKELRIILNAVRDNIFVGALKAEYNALFFASLRYILSEQSYVDWLFKTSFVKVKHNVGTLDQDKTFDTDTSASYEGYVNEVKPYKTVIREYLRVHDVLEETNTMISDFDLPPYYSQSKKEIVPSNVTIDSSDYQLITSDTKLFDYPRKNWVDNLGYQIVDIKVKDGGSGYTYKPIVKLVGGGGSGATAEAYLGYGKITRIKIINPGKGYVSAPRVVIEGSLTDNGIPATAVAILGNGAVRSSTIKIKFDRTTGSYFITSLAASEVFTGTNINTKFDLKWPMETKNSLVKIYIDGVEQLRSTYSYKNVLDTNAAYTVERGQVSFVNPPASGATIRVEYYKALSMLNAADRINLSSMDGELGKNLSYLMSGIDYGGVEITSFDFGGEAGWDTRGWYTDSWDIFDNTFEDEIFTFDQSTLAIELASPLEDGMTYNFYLKRIDEEIPSRIDDPNFGTELQTNPNALMPSIIGDGETTVINLGDYNFYGSDGDVLIVRKYTSDGSFIPDPDSYDTALSGGDLVYSTARGVNAEEIVVDGDGFVTPTTSGGPEELVPGQVLDTLDIKVYTRDSGGQGMIYSQNYIMDSAVTTYDLGVVPGSSPSVFVKVNNELLDDTEYTISWNDNTVTILAPVDGAELNITTVERGGQDILDYGRIDGVADVAEYNLPRKYVAEMSIFVSLNGEQIDVVLFENDAGNAAIRFEVALEEGDVVNWTLFGSNTTINYSQITKDVYEADGINNVYTLSSAPFYAVPTSHNIMVKVGNRILSPGYNIQYEVPANRQREYQLESFQQPGNALSTEDVHVYINGVKINPPVEWRFDIFNSSVILSDAVGNVGDLVEIYVVTDGEYTLDGTVLTLNDAPTAGEKVEVFKFSNHDIVGMERINYDVVSRDILLPEEIQYVTYQRLTVGEILLRRPAADVQYVWVSVNGELLSPSVDYYLVDNKTKVRLVRQPASDDVIDIIHFTPQVSQPKFAFRQFKDILNRTHFKRLDAPATTLAQPLREYDLRIEVEDGSTLVDPNKGSNLPGIIFVNGERIEYFIKEGNTLRQLRRGTLGTGVKAVHEAGTDVYDQTSKKTIPYKDVTQTQIIDTTGTDNTFTLNFTASSVNEFDVFVAGRRLRKTDITVFDPTLALDSPAGDTIAEQEFGVNPISSFLEVENTFTITSEPTTRDTKTDQNGNLIEYIVSPLGGTGKWATFKVTVLNGVATVNLINKGINYQVGDVLTISLTELGYTIDDISNRELADIQISIASLINGITMLETPEIGQKIVVTRKMGKIWTSDGLTLGEMQSDIGFFLRAGTTKLPE